ncbi:WD40-repeat-containing domain protein [Chytriomyces sp. MP71]|nr:WD40-repeat-containing domain protein [Chytriomyces sp. MP71]
MHPQQPTGDDKVALSDLQHSERVRLVAQMLYSLGMGESATRVLSDARLRLESESSESLKSALQNGDFARAEECLKSETPASSKSIEHSILAIRTQKYSELVRSQPVQALKVLRDEITPLCLSPNDHPLLQKLTSLIMVPQPTDASLVQISISAERKELLNNLQRSLGPHTMLPDNRLETLLVQAVQYQARECLYHNVPNESISLFNDHVCDRSMFPSKTIHVLDGHTDEVWFVSFSPDGSHLASASKDATAIIWDAKSFQPIHTLRGHSDHISVVAWSPDSQHLLTGSNDHSIKRWSIRTGTCVATYTSHTDTITSLAFLPPESPHSRGNDAFVSSSIDKNVFLWDAVLGRVMHRWNGVRVTDLCVTNDGARLVTISDRRIRIFDLMGPAKDEIMTMQESDSITSICAAGESNQILVNVSVCQEIHLWDIAEGRILRRFTGHKQGRFVIRSCFGGIHQTFVLSGSEDANVYVWNREHCVLLECLQGHTATVNSVSWNPSMNVFASASDDHTIRIWGCSRE